MSIVLVVEDDHQIRCSLQMLFECEGYQAHAVENGREALDFLKNTPRLPCLILLDLMMPVMDGMEFRRIQLEDAAIAHVPVVIVTGKANLSDVELLKPLNHPQTVQS